MTDEEQLKILRQGVAAWNEWRKENPDVRADLRGAELIRADLNGADLNGADLRGADLRGANLLGADLRGVNLIRAVLYRAILYGANLGKPDFAYLPRVDLSEANLSEADLRGADLRRADLGGAQLINTDLRNATLTGSTIFGVSVWGIKVDEGTQQQNLIITDRNEPEITVDNIEVAQFIYLLLNNQKIREVIDTIGRKLVLILGRFTPKRKRVLDALRDELRRRDYLPVVFDFEKPASRDLTETIGALAHMARFVIADLTEAKSLPQELGVIVPHLPSVAVQPIILRGAPEYAMFEHFRRYPWVFEVLEYDDTPLVGALAEQVVASLQAKGR
jgi:uncharacterized protein YjbI with pentapeptide repeats